MSAEFFGTEPERDGVLIVSNEALEMLTAELKSLIPLPPAMVVTVSTKWRRIYFACCGS